MTPASSVAVNLRWTGEGHVFRGSGASGAEVTFDGDSEVAPSPTESLLLSLAACMAIDIRDILEKGRVPVEDLTASVEGSRAEDHPRRFTGVRLRFRIAGPGGEDRGKVERALKLSRDKYCSVLHSLQPDLDLEMEIEIRA